MSTYSNAAHFDSIGSTVNVRFPLHLLSNRDQMDMMHALMELSGVNKALFKNEEALNLVFDAVQSYRAKEA